MTRTLIALALTLALATTATAGGVDKINGSVHVATGQALEDVSTVNGSVQVDGGAHVKDASTVNGSVSIGEGATAQAVDTVNGGISLGARSQVAGDVNAVNGSIHLFPGADARGKVANVNGQITVEGAHIGHGIETTSGGITLTGAARVDGGIHVEKPNTSWFSANNASKPPVIVIGPGAVVTGTLDFEREVELHVSDRAQVGTIRGATPIRFSGDTP
jgi:DUF4097 and DUF4098 domain-containing protein YvlB